jgi:alginate O-acetyltransferase complex protein AlgI
MAYDSIGWLAWMWLTVGLYWLSPRTWRLGVLVTISALFLTSLSPVSAMILFGFVLLAHFSVNVREPTWRTTGAGVAIVIAVLCWYKLDRAASSEDLMHSVLLPLGISYYSFRVIHFMIERYKRHVRRISLHDLFGYLFFLPTLYVGPIHRIDDFIHDLRRQRFDPAMLSEGAERIVYGYGKILVLSNFLVEDRFGTFIAGLGSPETALVTYLSIVQDGLNLYLQFSGYSDIAIGFARLLGFRVLENFNWPYFQPNIAAFWRSWHMSLSRWCREYIYGVVVSLTRSPALGALCVMVVIGLWHEISFRFLAWGVYHGLGLVVWQWWNKLGVRLPEAAPNWMAGTVHVAKVATTVHFVWFGFVILIADGPLAAIAIFQRFVPF